MVLSSASSGAYPAPGFRPPLLASSLLHVAADWPDARITPVLIVVLALAAIGTTVLFVAGLVAYSRRRQFRYLLITLALGALVARSIFGLGTVFGFVPMTVHHLVEHGLDFVVAVLILYAVYRSGPASSATSVGANTNADTDSTTIANADSSSNSNAGDDENGG